MGVQIPVGLMLVHIRAFIHHHSKDGNLAEVVTPMISGIDRCVAEQAFHGGADCLDARFGLQLLDLLLHIGLDNTGGDEVVLVAGYGRPKLN